jgi:hypothetical protein
MALNERHGKSINCRHSYTRPRHTCHQIDLARNLLHFYQLGRTSHKAMCAVHRPLQSESLAFMGLLNSAQGTNGTEQGESHLVLPSGGRATSPQK